jgi:hypothetical protein
MDRKIIRGVFGKASRRSSDMAAADSLKTAAALYKTLKTERSTDAVIDATIDEFDTKTTLESDTESQAPSSRAFEIDALDEDSTECAKCKTLSFISRSNKLCTNKCCNYNIFEYNKYIHINFLVSNIRKYQRYYLIICVASIFNFIFSLYIMRYFDSFFIVGIASLLAFGFFGTKYRIMNNQIRHLSSHLSD